MTIQKLKASLGCLFAGSLYALGFPSFIGETSLVGPIIGFAIYFYFCLNQPSLLKKVGLTIIFALGFNLLGFYWVAQTLEVFGGLATVVAWPLSLLFSLIIIPQHYFTCGLIHWWQKKFNHPQAASIIAIACFISLLEYFIPQQFPAHIGHALFPLAKKSIMVHFIGAIGYSFFSYSVALLIVYKKYKISILFILLFTLPHFAFPLNLATLDEMKSLRVRMVQANISNLLKVQAEQGLEASLQSVLQGYHQLSLEKWQHDSSMYPELIIWPETAYPHSLIGTDLKLDSINTPKIFKDIIKKTNAHLIIGGYDRKKEAPIYDYYETEFNSVFHFTPQFGLKDIYHKHILIPFGETLPFGPFNRELSQINQNVSFFAKGKDRTIFKLNDNIKFITPICYEILSPRFIRYYLNQDQQTQIIINLTNDSWYGDTAEPHQHLYLAKWRAIEFNKHLIRSTNTGISTIVLPDGNEINRLGVGERKYLDIEIKLPLNPQTTFYQKYELAGLGLLSLIMILIAHLTTYGLRLKALFN